MLEQWCRTFLLALESDRWWRRWWWWTARWLQLCADTMVAGAKTCTVPQTCARPRRVKVTVLEVNLRRTVPSKNMRKPKFTSQTVRKSRYLFFLPQRVYSLVPQYLWNVQYWLREKGFFFLFVWKAFKSAWYSDLIDMNRMSQNVTPPSEAPWFPTLFHYLTPKLLGKSPY
jgi:hypothetical protein